MKAPAHFLSDLDGQIDMLCASMDRIRAAHREGMTEKQEGVWEGQMRALMQTIVDLRQMRAQWVAGDPAFYQTEQMMESENV